MAEHRVPTAPSTCRRADQGRAKAGTIGTRTNRSATLKIQVAPCDFRAPAPSGASSLPNALASAICGDSGVAPSIRPAR